MCLSFTQRQTFDLSPQIKKLNKAIESFDYEKKCGIKHLCRYCGETELNSTNLATVNICQGCANSHGQKIVDSYLDGQYLGYKLVVYDVYE